MRVLKWTAATFAIFIAALAVFLFAFDWNLLRSYIGGKVTAQTGREFSIVGDLDVRLGLPPRIHAEQVRLENADWGTEPRMLDLASVDFTIRLLPLLRGEIVLPEVAFSRPVIVLEKNARGEGNWELSKKDKEDEETDFPKIGRLVVDEGTITYRDPEIATDIKAQVATDTARPEAVTRFTARGRFKDKTASASGSAGSVFLLTDQTQPFSLAGDVQVGATKAKLDGTITGLATFAAADLKLDLSGETLADLLPIIGVTLPETPPYTVHGRLVREADVWRFNDFAGKVGDSDLAGDLSVSTETEKPRLTAEISSKLLDFDDLAGLIGAPPDPKETASQAQKKKAAIEKAKPGVLPTREFRLSKLGAIDADVKYRAQSIRRREALPLDDLTAHFVLKDAVVTLKPLNFGVAGGNIVSHFIMNAAKTPMSVTADVNVRKLKLNQLFPKIETSKTSIGALGGRAQLSASGNSVAQWADTVDGNIGLAITGGQVSNLLLEVIGLDGGEIMKFLFAGDKNVTLRCAVANFDLKDGVMTADAFVVDTVDTNVLGEGRINLGQERLDLKMRPFPKDVSILSARSPIQIEGSFEDPDIKPDKNLFMRGGAALALGAINPLLALIPLIETGPGKDTNCTELLNRATEKSRSGAAGRSGTSPQNKPKQ